MDFRISEEQELLLDSLQEVLDRHCKPEYIATCYNNHETPVEFFEAMNEAGFGMLGIPEEYGGVPTDALTFVLIAEAITKHGGPHFGFGNALQVDDMLEFGSPKQVEITMNLLQKGKSAFFLGFSEPQSGSDNSSIATTFQRKNGKVYINGHKTFMTGAEDYPYMLCMARNADENEEDKTSAFTMWWIDMTKPGVKVVPIEKIGWNMQSTCEVYLEDVELDEEDLVGVEGNGFLQTMKNFEIERLVMAAKVVGMAECAFEDAARYANQRMQFGKPIGKFQLIQEKIVRMKIKIENMRNMIYKCAWEKDNGIPVRNSAALAKLYCAQSANEVIDDAMQIMGGIGYTKDCRISRLWRDARVFRIGGGTDEIMIHIAGRGILEEYK